MAAINCFLLPAHIVEDPLFRASTARERLYLLWSTSEFALHGPFYRADLEAAVILAMSVAKVRQARRRFSGLGWMQVTPGFQSQGRNLATRYLNVPCGQARVGEYAPPLHRYAFDFLLYRVGRGELRHADLLVYLYLEYLRLMNPKGARDRFDIAKNKLRDVSGLPNSLDSVRRLYRNFRFGAGAHLFEYEDHPDKLVFTSWARFADPSADETAQKSAEARDYLIKCEVQARKQARSAQKGLGTEGARKHSPRPRRARASKQTGHTC